VQFAAAMVIVETDPPKPFRGSSRIVEVLARALESTDTPRAVLAGPKPDQVNALAGLVGQSGYEAEIASSGRNAFRSAAGRGDVQLVVLDANVIQWSLSETVANLRADSRTAWIPIAVVGDPMRIASVERMISRDPLMVYIQRPANLKGLQDQLGPFISGLGTEPLSAVERGELSRAAVDLLGFLADGRRATVFDLRPAEAGLHAAIQVPELADGAIYAMAAIATTSAQDRLATTALQPDLAEGTRERAAAQLAFHIQKHGVLLAGTRVQQLQQVHAEEASPAVKSSLAAVLGTLGPSAARIGQRLRAVPLPAPR
jgi:CheY-like chemotaxis protein